MDNEDRTKGKKRLRKAIRESLEQIKGDSVIKQSLGEVKYKVNFAPEFVDDLTDILSETPKQREEREDRHVNLIIEHIQKSIENKGEVVFVSEHVLEHYLTDGKFNSKAYFDHRCGGTDIYNSHEEFCEKILPDLLENGITILSDIFLIVNNPDGGKLTRYVFNLGTRDYAADCFKEDIKNSINYSGKNLLGNREFDLFITEGDRKKDRSYKKAIWENVLKDYEDIVLGINGNDEQSLLMIKDKAIEYLNSLSNHLSDYEFQYEDEQEWGEDCELITDYIESLEKNEPFIETRGSLIFTPTVNKSITVKDSADAFRRWIDTYVIPKKPFRLRYGSLLDEMLTTDRLLKECCERLGDEYEDPGTRARTAKEFQEKHSLNCLPYGKVF